MEIIRGKLPGAKKVVVYGPEGIGKSTFASHFPDPVFIDTEGSTKDMDVSRFPEASSWTMLLEQVQYVTNHPEVCRTLVIDTIDWAEAMCIEHVCSIHQKKGIEDFGYGNGYVYVKEEFGRFLNKLSEVVKAGVNVVLTAHAQIRKFEQPDEMGAYDRYELKLGKKTASQTSPIVKEWADMLLFANYKTYSVSVDDKGKKHKAQGGSRVMYTTHHPCWDAKNRYGLAEELPFEYTQIAHIIKNTTMSKHQKTEQKPVSAPEPQKNMQMQGEAVQQSFDFTPKESDQQENVPENDKRSALYIDERIPKALRDLMISNNVLEDELQAVVVNRGYYPDGVPIKDYDPDFINGCLIGAWGQVFGFVKEMREKQEVPFNH